MMYVSMIHVSMMPVSMMRVAIRMKYVSMMHACVMHVKNGDGRTESWILGVELWPWLAPAQSVLTTQCSVVGRHQRCGWRYGVGWVTPKWWRTLKCCAQSFGVGRPTAGIRVVSNTQGDLSERKKNIANSSSWGYINLDRHPNKDLFSEQTKISGLKKLALKQL